MSSEKNDPSTSATRSKAEEAAEEARAAPETVAGPSSSSAAPPAYQATASDIAPTVTSPFNFPSDTELPPYEPPIAAPGSQKPIAIPQIKPDPAIPFIPVYSQVLLSHGITVDTWRTFLETISAFLTAKVGDRAISHAGDMAKTFTNGSVQFSKNLVNESKKVGKGIASKMKRGNVIGAAGQAIGGVISLPLSFAFGLVGTATSLPFSAASAVFQKPKTPGQRAALYAALSNEKWLHARGLHAQIMDTQELAQSLGMGPGEFLAPAQETKDRRPSGQLEALEGHIERLELTDAATLDLSSTTLWLVLAPLIREPQDASPTPTPSTMTPKSSHQ